jgi:phosphoribosyl 1,2-cyclic phosphodiesterase
MKIKFWGVRGSIATPLPAETISNKIKEALKLATISDILSEEAIDSFINTLPFSLRGTFGGNTSCIEFRSSQDDLFILDGGSGIRPLGIDLLAKGFGQGGQHANIYLSHTHWDHIQGLPFFVPLFIPGNSFTFYSALEDLEQRLRQQQDPRFFPVNLDHMAADKTFVTLPREESFEPHPGLRIAIQRMIHPGGSFAIRFEENGKRFIYGSDAEFNINNIDNIAKYSDFFAEADVLVFDTQYTFEESLQKIDWGHSNASIAIDIANKFAVKKLVLFHHDPMYDDNKIDELFIKAKRYQDMLQEKKDLDIIPAHEGLELDI